MAKRKKKMTRVYFDWEKNRFSLLQFGGEKLESDLVLIGPPRMLRVTEKSPHNLNDSDDILDDNAVEVAKGTNAEFYFGEHQYCLIGERRCFVLVIQLYSRK